MGTTSTPVKMRIITRDKAWINDVLSVNNSSFNMYTIGTESITRNSNPYFRNQILSGTDASTAYTRNGFDVTAGIVSGSTKAVVGGNRFRGERYDMYVNSLPSTTFDSGLVVNDASNILKRKLRQFTGQSNQLINVAELRELPKLIQGIAGSATNLINLVTSSKRRGNDLIKFASDSWLTWSFGISPTIGAVDDAIASVNDYLSKDNHTVKEYGIFTKDSIVSATTLNSTGPDHALYDFYGRYKANLSCKLTAGYKYTLSSSNNYSLPKHLGFDISSVVPTIWELIPYSWMIDYFTTAGSFIEDNFSADFGTSVYLCQNVLYKLDGEVSCKIKPIGSGQITGFTHIPMKYKYFHFTRTPLLNLPRAPLRFKTSDEIAHSAVNKLLNLASLLGAKKK